MLKIHQVLEFLKIVYFFNVYKHQITEYLESAFHDSMTGEHRQGDAHGTCVRWNFKATHSHRHSTAQLTNFQART